ncbi:MAG: XRE family transcriptional regulator [Acidobacteria bacterium]|nr:XRE family transcriptional regulator [Acidobacteriota bacterium]
MRAELVAQIRKLTQKRKLTQAEAATLLGVSQPRVSDLLRGKIELFSVDALVKMLWRAGLGVSIVIKDRARVA